MTDTYARAKALAVRYPYSISDLLTARSRMEEHLVEVVGVSYPEANDLADDFLELAIAIGTAANLKPAAVFEKLRRPA